MHASARRAAALSTSGATSFLVHALAASEHELRQYRAVLDADEDAVLDAGGRIDPDDVVGNGRT